MEKKNTVEMTFKFEDPGLTEKERKFLMEALKSTVVAVLAARAEGKRIRPPQFNSN